MSSKVLLEMLQAQMQNLTILHPALASAIVGYIVHRLTRKILHIIVSVIAIILLYEVFVVVTGFGLPENIKIMLASMM